MSPLPPGRGGPASWRPTTALGRALVVGGLGVVGALLSGEPAVVVLAAPFVMLAALGVAHRPTREPVLDSRLDHLTLREGVGTTSRLSVAGAEDAEYLVRVTGQPPYVVMRPSGGRVGRLLAGGQVPEVEISPRRWGRRMLGEEKVALYTPWAGYRFGPVGIGGQWTRVLPTTAPYDSRAEAPQPLGLVGAHRSRRTGSGTELAGIRPFQPGDRLRRVNWRVSLRTRDLHVVTTRAEEDTGVLLVLDALADHGASDGVDGAASSLDLGVRAASAIAEHHVRRGDRVALRVVGRGHEQVGYGAGPRHLRRIQDQLATVRIGVAAEPDSGVLQLGVTGGVVVVVLSPMLAEPVATVAATLTRRGVAVLVVDTLPPDPRPDLPGDADPTLAALAWRMRMVERSVVLDRLAALGCPVVAWRGPGTIDDVLRRLARRGRLPRVVGR
ncbi:MULTISPECIES: DUF58 domain-containing protein [unclassified Nocardioides]|uniref:DUF58 domain-containing protein n=1 Tax=unclassified Nocardioides TaxID=2615069 RepID=UPI0000EB60FC|nr:MULTISPECIES: DUF58 domain-containing protein [unclassified Nocardioides]ABL80993.1 protein of unknown function DUF58 [Nocardioides sp. JS614]